MLTLITLPAPATFLADVGAWTDPIFTDLLPIAIYGIGILLAFAIPVFLVKLVSSAVARIMHHD